MLNPYQILEVSLDASDEMIKKQYLEKVKAYPPEHHPDKFERIRTAYEKIATQYLRVSYALLEEESVEIDDVLQTLIQEDDVRRPTEDELLTLLS